MKPGLICAAALALALTLAPGGLAVAGSHRATADRPDVSPEHQVHLVYAIPKSGKDRRRGWARGKRPDWKKAMVVFHRSARW